MGLCSAAASHRQGSYVPNLLCQRASLVHGHLQAQEEKAEKDAGSGKGETSIFHGKALEDYQGGWVWLLRRSCMFCGARGSVGAAVMGCLASNASTCISIHRGPCSHAPIPHPATRPPCAHRRPLLAGGSSGPAGRQCHLLPPQEAPPHLVGPHKGRQCHQVLATVL